MTKMIEKANVFRVLTSRGGDGRRGEGEGDREEGGGRGGVGEKRGRGARLA